MTTIPSSIPTISLKPHTILQESEDEEDEYNEETMNLHMPDLSTIESDEEKEESFDEAIRRIQHRHLVKNFSPQEDQKIKSKKLNIDSKNLVDTNTNLAIEEGEEILEASVESQPEVVEDFLRNFLVSKNMFTTLESFQNEWYERQQKNAEELSEAAFVPEVYHQNSILETKLTQLRLEARAFKQLAENTQSQFNQLRKEKEYLKLQYQRSLQDKSKLQTRCQEQKREIDQFKSTQIELQAKLDHMLKLNTLLKLGRDKESPKKDGEKEKENLNKVKIDIEHAEPATKEKFEPQGLTKHKEKQNIPTSLPTVNEPTRKSVTLSPSHKVTLKKKMGLSHSLPNEDRYNPHIDTTYTPLCITRIQALHEILCIKAHSLSVSNLTFHPRKMVLASASDDKSWKLWNFPSGELLMCGEGHKSWISGIDFHPNGHYLATSSGDLTIKLWDFSQPQALLTMADHLRPVWACLIHDAGNHLLSCSLDATAKLWDLTTGRCKQTFRAHTDSVNSIAWQHFTNIFYTCSGDKCILSWDARMSHPAQQFRGHATGVNDITCSLDNQLLVTGDSEGMLKLWDPRTTHELLSVTLGPSPINQVVLDPAHSTVAAASQDGHCKIFSIKEQIKRDFIAHQDAVQACLFCPMQPEYLITCSSDHTIKLWN